MVHPVPLSQILVASDVEQTERLTIEGLQISVGVLSFSTQRYSELMVNIKLKPSTLSQEHPKFVWSPESNIGDLIYIFYVSSINSIPINTQLILI